MLKTLIRIDQIPLKIILVLNTGTCKLTTNSSICDQLCFGDSENEKKS